MVGLESSTGEQYGYFIPKIYDVVTVTLLLKPGEGEGEFPVAMMLYKDNTYEEVYNEPPTLNVTDRLVALQNKPRHKLNPKTPLN